MQRLEYLWATAKKVYLDPKWFKPDGEWPPQQLRRPGTNWAPHVRKSPWCLSLDGYWTLLEDGLGELGLLGYELTAVTPTRAVVEGTEVSYDLMFVFKRPEGA